MTTAVAIVILPSAYKRRQQGYVLTAEGQRALLLDTLARIERREWRVG